MKPTASARCLLPEAMVQNNLGRAFSVLFSPEPPPEEWIASRRRADKAAGFKIMAHQVLGLRSEPEFWDYLDANRVRAILCLRHNVLMQHVSDVITLATRQSACYNGEVRTARVNVNTDTLGYELQKITTQRRYLTDAVERLGLDHRRVYYEDLKDTTAPAEELLYWLIGERGPLTTKLLKQNPDGLRARVINYDEMAAQVRRLDLAHLLEPGG